MARRSVNSGAGEVLQDLGVTQAQPQRLAQANQPKITVPATPRVQVPSVSPQNLTESLPGGVKLELVKIPAGSFLMGSNEREDEKPIHQVNLKEFYLGKYLVTQEQWQAIIGNNPSHFSGNPQNPVEKVSWNDCQAFCQQLSQITGKKYRLPSEAEWEYSCRAGTQTRYYFGDHENQLGDYAWYQGVLKGNSQGKTHPVGQKKPNPWGLYDMHGNVWEWCEDQWNENYQSAPIDGSAWIGNNSHKRVVRGGSWYNGDCRSAFRSHFDPAHGHGFSGFRVVCVRPRVS